jgi:hypothetical protein
MLSNDNQESPDSITNRGVGSIGQLDPSEFISLVKQFGQLEGDAEHGLAASRRRQAASAGGGQTGD